MPACVRGWPVLIAAGWWAARRSPRPIAAVADASAERWLGWVLTPLAWRVHVDAVARDAVALGGRVVLNPEAAWKEAPEGEARALVRALRERGVRDVWCCSYAWPSAAGRRFPWSEFAAECEGGIALTFDRREERRTERDEAAFVARALEQWTSRGFARVLVSLGAWRQDQSRPKSERELSAELATRPPNRTVAWVPQWSAAVCRALAAWAEGRALAPSSDVGSGSGGAIVAALVLALGLYFTTTR